MARKYLLAASAALALAFPAAVQADEVKVVLAKSEISDPFERSNQRCKNADWTVSCVRNASEVDNDGNIITIGRVAEELHMTYEEFIAMNQWLPGEVSPDTPIPPWKRYAFSVVQTSDQ